MTRDNLRRNKSGPAAEAARNRAKLNTIARST
jgi:hypothetical protein